MGHLHIPDGVLPFWLWAGGWGLAILLLGLASFHHRRDRPDRLTLLASLSALMLAAMAVPLGPFGHLGLAAVVGILLGPSLAFVAAALVNLILALLGHGGLSVIGLNALVLGAGAALARPAYGLLRRRFEPGRAAAGAAVIALAVSALALFAVVAMAGTDPVSAHDGAGADHGHGLGTKGFVLLSLPLWIFGGLVEALVTASLISFLARVEPGLLPPDDGTQRAWAPFPGAAREGSA